MSPCLSSLIRSDHSPIENLFQYVMMMLCTTMDWQPNIGILYAPFSDKTGEKHFDRFSQNYLLSSLRIVWGWVDVGHSSIEREKNSLTEVHRENIDEIILSRSHVGYAHELLRVIVTKRLFLLLMNKANSSYFYRMLNVIVRAHCHISRIPRDQCSWNIWTEIDSEKRNEKKISINLSSERSCAIGMHRRRVSSLKGTDSHRFNCGEVSSTGLRRWHAWVGHVHLHAQRDSLTFFGVDGLRWFLFLKERILSPK